MWTIKYTDPTGFWYSEPKVSRLANIFDLVNQGFDRVEADLYDFQKTVKAELIKL